jgi:DHA2 family multidrug resistance protein-like MFS transporter
VAVIGSVMSTRYRSHLTAALAGRGVPGAVSHTILGSLGGALTVAGDVGGVTGALLAGAARSAFMSGNHVALAVGGAVSVAGVVLVLMGLPSRSGHGDA